MKNHETEPSGEKKVNSGRMNSRSIEKEVLFDSDLKVSGSLNS
jgi:hypothetical protein